MEQEKFYLELSGTLIDGHQLEDAAAGLGRLLRIDEAQACEMLSGTPSRIRKPLSREKAEYLLVKLTACGVGALVVPVSTAHRSRSQAQQDDVVSQLQDTPVDPQPEVNAVEVIAEQAITEEPATEEMDLSLAAEGLTLDLPMDEPAAVEAGEPVVETAAEPDLPEQTIDGGLTLELDPIEAPAAPVADDPVDDVTRPLEAVNLDDLPEADEVVVLETPKPQKKVAIDSKADSAEEDKGQFFPEQNTVAEPAPVKRAAISKPVLLVVAVLLLGGAVFAGFQLIGGTGANSRSAPAAVAEPPQPARPVAPVDPEMEISRAGLQSLGRLVKVWMIQFGSGFDPQQVTLERMRLDLQLGAEELVDGWGNDYRYRVEAKRYLIQSAGPDRQFDTADDLQQAFGSE